MSTAVELRKDETTFVQEMNRYLTKLKEQQAESHEAACQEAKKALKRTGVTTKSGKTKKKIVSWE